VAQWKLNLVYLIAMTGGTVALFIPSTLVVRRKMRNKSLAKKVHKKPIQGPGQALSEDDTKIYDYILAHNGMLKYSKCMKKFGYSREQINQSIQNLKDSHMISDSSSG